MIKKCVICGKEFESVKAHTITCSPECAKERNIITNRLYYEKHKRTKKKKSKQNTLVDINKKARDSGMTYGEYVGLVLSREVKE